MNFADFHFEQPLWFFALIPVAVIFLLLWKRHSQQGNWQTVIDADLLPYLLSGRNQQKHSALIALLLGWLLAVIALAGPSWEKLPQPLLQKQDGLVILFDLSYSMYAEDIQPSRLVRARQKVLDILQQRKEGLTGLVSFAGDAHIVSPMTDDVATIANLVPSLAPEIMPVLGSNPEAAVKLGLELFKNSGLDRGRLLLISDALTDADIDAIHTQLSGKNFALSLLAVGTKQGAPIPFDNGFVRDNNGSIVLPTLDIATFNALSQKTGARFSEIQLDNRDIKSLLPDTHNNLDELKTIDRTSDQWRNRGPWLVMLLLPLAALAFRRGWLFIIAALLVINQPSDAYALEWKDLWQTRDQQAAEQLRNGDAKSAAETFENSRWKGSALYQANDYQKAAEEFSRNVNSENESSADDFYNQGNALARSGKLDEALAAYDKALAKNPQNEDASFNKALIEKLKQQQQNQQSSQPSDQQQQNRENPSQENPSQENPSEKNQAQQNSQDGQSEDKPSAGNKSDENQNPESSQQSGTQNQQSENKPQQNTNQQDNPEFQEQSAMDQQNREQQEREQQSAKKNTASQSASRDNDKKATDETSQAHSLDEKDKNNPDEKNEKEKPAQALSAEELQKQQQQQATEQWLRQIPDDPGGLMQRKFRYEYEQRRRNGDTSSGNQQPW